jgi:hypothetical protein
MRKLSLSSSILRTYARLGRNRLVTLLKRSTERSDQQTQQHPVDDSARFLTSQNPAQMKRNVISSFTDVLLLPVTIVPRAVGGAVIAGGNAAVQGIAMLNPQRWAGGQTSAQPNGASVNGYTKRFDEDDGTVFEIGPDDDDEEEEDKPKDDSKEATFHIPPCCFIIQQVQARMMQLLSCRAAELA